MNYRDLIGEILRQLRGNATRGAISRRLGYTYNKYSKWESGSSRVQWQEFADVCRLKGVELSKLLRRYTGFAGDSSDSVSLLGHLRGIQSLTLMAEKLGCSRPTLNAWLRGDSDVTLEAILTLIDARGELYHFLSSLVEVDVFPGLPNSRSSHKQIRSFLADHPECSKLLPFFDLEPKYLPKRKELAEQCGLTKEELDEKLCVLQKLGVLCDEKGRLTVSRELGNTGGHTIEDYFEGLAIKQFWIEQSLRYIERERQNVSDSQFGFESLAMSKEAYRKLVEISAQYFHEIRRIVSEDDGDKSIVAVANISLLKVYDANRRRSASGA